MKLKAFEDNQKKRNVTEKLKFVMGREERIAGNVFPTMFSKGFFFKVVKSHDCVVKS